MNSSIETLAVVQVTGEDRAGPRGPGRVARHGHAPTLSGRHLELNERGQIGAVHVELAARVAQPAAPPAVAQPDTDGVRTFDEEVGDVECRVAQPVPVAGPAGHQLLGTDPGAVDLGFGQAVSGQVEPRVPYGPIEVEFVS